MHPATGVLVWWGYIYTGVVALAGTSTGSVTAFALTPAYNRGKPTTWVIAISLSLLPLHCIHRLGWEGEIQAFGVEFLKDGKVYLCLSSPNVTTTFYVVNKSDTQ